MVKRKFQYQVEIGFEYRDGNSQFLSFALDTASPEIAIQIILSSDIFQETVRKMNGTAGVSNPARLTNFSGPHGQTWTES